MKFLSSLGFVRKATTSDTVTDHHGAETRPGGVWTCFGLFLAPPSGPAQGSPGVSGLCERGTSRRASLSLGQRFQGSGAWRRLRILDLELWSGVGLGFRLRASE